MRRRATLACPLRSVARLTPTAPLSAAILNVSTNPSYDSYYVSVYTDASEAIAPGRPHLRGQVHSLTPGVAGNIPNQTGRC
jgi:hypothetical protein